MVFFNFKVIFLRNSKDIINTMKYLKQAKTLPHNISFNFYPITNFDKKGFCKNFKQRYSNRNMPLVDECLNAECRLHY